MIIIIVYNTFFESKIYKSNIIVVDLFWFSNHQKYITEKLLVI